VCVAIIAAPLPYPNPGHVKANRGGKERDVEEGRRLVDSMEVDDFPEDMDAFVGEDDGSEAPSRDKRAATKVASKRTTSKATKGAASKAKGKPSTSKGTAKKLVSSLGFCVCVVSAWSWGLFVN
jgi:hypothetical protein